LSLLAGRGRFLSILPASLVVVCLLQQSAGADILHLKSGGTVDIGWDYRTSGDRVIIQKEAGTIAIPLSDVDRIEKTQPKASPSPGRVQQVPQPAEEPQPEASQDLAPREILSRVLEEVLDFLGQIGSSGELTEEARQEGLALSEEWLQDVRAALEAEGGSEADLREVGEDLIRGLGELQKELQSGRLERGRDLKQAFQSMLDRIS